MDIEYSDIREDVLAYKVLEDVVYANYRGKVYKADFTNFKDGEMVENNIIFISKAYKEDGILNVTLRRPVDANGNEIPQEDFSIDEYEEAEIKWKTQEEKLLESIIPTKKEVEDAELEINVINLLQDLEVIQ